MFVATESLRQDLESRGFKNCIAWTRGVDTELFCPSYNPMTRQRFALYVGRVSKEKNIEAFLDLKYAGDKVVVGDGPQLNELKQKYPNVQFKGVNTGPFLTWYYQNAEVFVFPSKSDTFGLVMLEALACGTPVAAYNVTGPKDIIIPSVGCVDDDLQKALDTALQCDRIVCRNYAEQYSWKNAVDIFIKKITTS
jgi:glycosyltransferase involved in cell wall biosynthesis